MPRVIHFEITAENLERACAFYEGLFGWKINTWPGSTLPYRLVTTGPASEPGIDGAIMNRPDPSLRLIQYVQVQGLDDYLARAAAAGATVLRPKMEIPGVGWSALFLDPEGNPCGLFEPLGPKS